MPVAFTAYEGGEWISFLDPRASTYTSCAALLYEDGWIYDFVLKRCGFGPWRKFGEWPVWMWVD